MKFIKSFVPCVMAIAFSAFAIPSIAQIAGPSQFMSWSGTVVAGGVTNFSTQNTNSVGVSPATIYNGKNIFFYLYGQAMTTNAGGTIYAGIIRSVDNVHWETNGSPFLQLSIALPANTTTSPLIVSSNIDCGAFQYYSVAYVSNSLPSGWLTNCGVGYGIKPGF